MGLKKLFKLIMMSRRRKYIQKYKLAREENLRLRTELGDALLKLKLRELRDLKDKKTPHGSNS